MKRALMIAALVGLPSLVLAGTGRPPLLNEQGSMTILVVPTSTDSVSVRMVSGSYIPDSGNTFGAKAVTNTFYYYELSRQQTDVLGSCIKEWTEAPTAQSVYSTSEGSFGFSAAGSFADPELPPVLVLQILSWINEGAQQHHGGTYQALPVADAQALATALTTWAANPYTNHNVYEKLTE